MKKPYLERIKEGVILFDGAMGTMLYDKGIFINQCFENINLTDPDKVMEIHREMASAGAQVLTTNTFGANPIRLKSYDLDDKTAMINRQGVMLAKTVAGEDLYVAGSVGPTGVRPAPVGNTPVEEITSSFKIQIEALLEGGIDLLLFETFKNIDELLLAVRAARTLSTDIPIQAQVSIYPNDSEDAHERYIRLFRQLDSEEAIDVIGMNCSTGPASMLDILQVIQNHVKKPVSIMPNAGFPRDVEGRQLYLASPDYFAEYSLKFLDIGVNVIGGCCGTTPEHIRKMGKSVLSIDRSRRRELKIEINKKKSYEPVPLKERSRLGKALYNNTWVTAIELVPPVGINLDRIKAKVSTLSAEDITAINIPDGPRASSRISALLTSMEITRSSGIETIPHICCRDKNLIALQSELLSAQAAGLHNVLIITGDPPKTGDFPDVSGVFDVDSIGLIALASRLNRGIDLAGNLLPQPTTLVIGAGANPAAQNQKIEIERAFLKAEAGAEYFITQPVFDIDQLLSFLENIKATGIPVIAGVWPLASYRNALFLNNEVPGVTIPEEIMKRMSKYEDKIKAREEGILIARTIISEIKDHIAGVQVSPPFGRIETALNVIQP